ncbi:unnamed protein product, partial [Sphenostylis stenocarpa]
RRDWLAASLVVRHSGGARRWIAVVLLKVWLGWLATGCNIFFHHDMHQRALRQTPM